MKYSYSMSLVLLLCTLSQGTITRAQLPLRLSEAEVATLLSQLEAHTKQFQQALTRALPQSVLRNAPLGNSLQQYTDEVKQITQRLRSNSQQKQPVAADVQEVLNRGPYLETMMSSYDFGPQVEQAWQTMAADLDQLARAFRLETYWGMPTEIGSPPRPDLNPMANRLIGTYEWQEAQSDKPQKMLEEAARQIPTVTRRRWQSGLLPRLRAPKSIAFDRQGDQVMVATSLQPVRTYKATGRAYSERVGHDERVLLYSNSLRLNLPGEEGRRYAITYATIENGARLKVTHTAFLPDFPRPLISVSHYKKISDVPLLQLGAEEAGEHNSTDKKKQP